MRIADAHLNTVAFLCAEQEVSPGVTAVVPGATAFFVLMPEDDFWISYVVTARHALEEIGARPIILRANRGDQFEDLPPIDRNDWFTHDTADVATARFRGEGFALSAIMPGDFVGADYQYRVTNPGMRMFTLEGQAQGQAQGVSPTARVEVGHEVFFIGLFIQHAGRKRNLPVARFGQISRMPVEPVTYQNPDGSYSEALAYLVECRSWGGHSGSPVFWRHPVIQHVAIDALEDTPEHLRSPEGKLWVQNPDADMVGFLGLVSAHFDISKKAETEGDIQGSITTAVNSGMAVVTPAEAIRELLTREDVVEDRKEEARRAKQAMPPNAATLDSAMGKALPDEFANFERLTERLLEVPKSELDEKRKEDG